MNQVGTIEKLVMAFVSVVMLLSLYFSISDPQFFKEVFTMEDGFVEWCTVIALFTSFLICLRRLITLRKQKSALFLFVTLFLTLFSLFGAGEEISWGQRIFNLESPEYFLEHNAQEEIGLHNLTFEYNGKKVKLNKLIFGTGLALAFLIYLALMTPLYRRKPYFQALFDNLAIPMPKNYQIVSFVVLITFVELLIDSSKRGEMTEFSGSLVFMLTIWFPYNKPIFEPASKSDA